MTAFILNALLGDTIAILTLIPSLFMTTPQAPGIVHFLIILELLTFWSILLSMSLRGVCVIVFCLGSAVLDASRHQDGATVRVTNPVSRIDLRPKVGSVPLGLVVGRDHEAQLHAYTSLRFLDNTTIAVTFVIHQQGVDPKLSRHGAPDENLPLRLRAVFLDAITGKVT